LARQAGAGPSGEREPDTLQDVVEPCGETRVRGGQLSERLGERATRAAARAADETSDRQPDHDALPAEREILQPAL
jgi:hypothetical protein